MRNPLTRIVLVALLASIALAGCRHAPPRPPPPPPAWKAMRVYTAPPSEPYTVIASITASDSDLDEVLDELREQAASRGGDAAVITLQADTDRHFLRGSQIQMAADVIRFR